MGSCITHMFDNYETYVAFCELVNENHFSVSDDFYSHEQELMEKHGYVKCGCWYEKCNVLGYAQCSREVK